MRWVLGPAPPAPLRVLNPADTPVSSPVPIAILIPIRIPIPAHIPTPIPSPFPSFPVPIPYRVGGEVLWAEYAPLGVAVPKPAWGRAQLLGAPWGHAESCLLLIGAHWRAVLGITLQLVWRQVGIIRFWSGWLERRARSRSCVLPRASSSPSHNQPRRGPQLHHLHLQSCPCLHPSLHLCISTSIPIPSPCAAGCSPSAPWLRTASPRGACPVLLRCRGGPTTSHLSPNYRKKPVRCLHPRAAPTRNTAGCAPASRRERPRDSLHLLPAQRDNPTWSRPSRGYSKTSAQCPCPCGFPNPNWS